MPEKAAYTEPSSDYTNDNIPQFKVDNFSFSLLKKEPASSEWEKIDGLQSVRLKKSEFDKVFSAWDILVIAFGAMIGWGWV